MPGHVRFGEGPEPGTDPWAKARAKEAAEKKAYLEKKAKAEKDKADTKKEMEETEQNVQLDSQLGWTKRVKMVPRRIIDADGDGVVSDQEFEMKQKLVLLENEDKKQDQQRYLVWFSALSVTVFIVVLMTPLIPMERIDHLSGIAEIWVLSNMGVIGSFIGFNQIAKKKEFK